MVVLGRIVLVRLRRCLQALIGRALSFLNLTLSQEYNTLSKAFRGALGLGLVGASPGQEKQVPPNVQETWAGSLALSPEIPGPPQFHRFFYNQVLLRA